MSQTASSSEGTGGSGRTPRLLERKFREIAERSSIGFSARFANGQTFSTAQEPVIALAFHTHWAEVRAVLFGHIGLLEAYFDGSLDIEGDLSRAFAIAFESGFNASPSPLVRIRNRWHEFRLGNRTVGMAKRNAREHYGLSADFYSKWLDLPYMMYTCGYWPEGTETIEQAQRNKLEHVCRKVKLSPGDRVVDIGCGFGGFMQYAHEAYGVTVRGTNTTTEQVDWLAKRIRAADLDNALEVVEADFREVDEQYDKVISIGVLEHAGRDQIVEVVRAHADMLKPGGLGMLHFIGHVGQRDTEFFIRRHVFPGGWIPSLSETLDAMEASGLEILDVENLRRHYALTLDAWSERFDSRWDEIHALDPGRFNERFRRIWRTYLLSCAEMFRAPRGQTHLFQILFSKGNTESYPMSRSHLYDESSADAADRDRS